MKTLNTVLFQSEDNTIWILLHSFIQSGLTAEITIGAGSKQRLQTEQILARDTLLCWANTHTFLLIIRLKTSFLSIQNNTYKITGLYLHSTYWAYRKVFPPLHGVRIRAVELLMVELPAS